MRYAYFVFACSVAVTVFKIHKAELERQNSQQEEGVEYEDISEEHKKLRESNVDHAFLYTYKAGEGLVREEFHRELYMQELEKRAQQRARDAKVLAEMEARMLEKNSQSKSSQ